MQQHTTIPGKFVWFELVTRDPKKAQSFYADVFGWRVQAFPMEGGSYDMILLGAAGTMIGGYVADAACPRAHWTAFVSVADVDASAAAATASGGGVVEAPRDVPRTGRRALVADAQGATLGLFKNAAGDAPDGPTPTGGFLWVELHTPDPASGLAFWNKVVGFTHRSMDMGPGGTYHILAASGADRGGVTAMLPPGVPPHWLPYLCVENTDAIVDKARKAGARILMGAEDVPGAGRLAVLEDPTGAAFALLKPMPQTKSAS